MITETPPPSATDEQITMAHNDALSNLSWTTGSAPHRVGVSQRAVLDELLHNRELLKQKDAELARFKEAKPVAWVEVVDSLQGPYRFHGREYLPAGNHELFAAPQPEGEKA